MGWVEDLHGKTVGLDTSPFSIDDFLAILCAACGFLARMDIVIRRVLLGDIR